MHPKDRVMRNHHTAKCCLLFFASTALLTRALVSHNIKVMRNRERRPHLHLFLRRKSTAHSGANHVSTDTLPPLHKSPESNFWIAVPPNSTTTSSTSNLPAVHALDKETGPLPLGAYHNVDKDVTAPCLIAVGIRPPSNAVDGQEVWREGVKNCQKLIDSGFNTFRVNNYCGNEKKGNRGGIRKRSKPPSYMSMEKNKQQTDIRLQAETNFYRTLRQNTPSSVLRSCHFMVNMEIPSILSLDTAASKADKELTRVPFGNGWMVRDSVGNALLRTKGECLDSVVLEYCRNSPYHLDVLDVLSEMKREGLVHSISTKNCPPSLLQSAQGCGFIIHSNDVYGNLMNTNNLQLDSELGMFCNDNGCSRIISAPLGGGLFTNQFYQFKVWEQLSASRKRQFNALLDACCKMHHRAQFDIVKKWSRYRSMMDTLVDISLKHQVSVESIALRWLLQLNDGDSISVGTFLGMDFVEQQGGQPFNRHRNLRQIFTFSLEEDDMERLRRVTGLSRSGAVADHEIDFTNKALWM